MSKLETNTIDTVSGTNTLQVGDGNVATINLGKSGDTINIPSGATLANSGTVTGVASLSTASGSAPSYSARAWVKFNGTGTVSIYGSGNVSSIGDIGVGNYQVNFSTAMADTNYSITFNNGNGLLSTGTQQFPVTVCDWNSTSQINYNLRQCDNDANTFITADGNPCSIAIFR
jgi:uncharacterized protein (AIM24 family)